MLYSAIEQAPSAELVEPDYLTRYFSTFDEQFFHYCDKELAKINTFYSGWHQIRRTKHGTATRMLNKIHSILMFSHSIPFHSFRFCSVYFF